MLKQAPTIRPIASYNELLKRKPLLVKSVTGAVLCATGELISQSTTATRTGDGEKLTTMKQKIIRILSLPKYKKILLMFLYGGLINAPISHFLYKWITALTNKHVIAKWRRLAQLCGSWFVVSPIQVFFLVAALTVVNVEKRLECTKYLLAIKQSLRTRYSPMLTSSICTSTILVTFAQQFIAPEKWSVFLSFAYAGLNTGQNIYMKLATPKDKEEKPEEQKE